ncbi:hypothetical protein HIM_11055 [Hirsutella minnesotensis 3608]|uniref:Uncharacterized protein n=1 Tax=Hirsutella minnesotensis 3608 TaxID=1043627 RepID=A0A0F7ZWU1_9HYPO|nr:hypothetical protein HIM_11055 [Hirsutella minnesotensis 3608]
MEEIHVSWHGPEKPAPKDLSGLLSVRRQVVERALVWLRENNPHYAGIVIDTKEMNSWAASEHGVPGSVYGRMERNEPSPWERTRTAHVVPPTERAMDEEESRGIEEIFDMLSQTQDPLSRRDEDADRHDAGDADTQEQGESEQTADAVNEVTATQGNASDSLMGARAWVGSLPGEQGVGGDETEPYIHVHRGDDFADSFDAFFFAKAFPALMPFGFGGPRLAEEATLKSIRGISDACEAEGAVDDLISSRNMSLRRWAATVLRRHGGRFATHHIFAFLVFNMGVRSRNRRISMLSVAKKNFGKVERIVRALDADRLAAARAELEKTGKTNDTDVKELLRSLSLYGYRQPMSREMRMSMRHKILALIVRYEVPAIWFTINPNDITNPVKLRLAAYRARDPGAAEEFLRSLDMSFKRLQLSISDPMSSAMFFHREMTLFFEHYVRVGEESVFGRIAQYYGAVETNERGSLHVHGLLWLHGNANLSSMLAETDGEDQGEYRDRIVRYVDSVFSEELDQEACCAIQAERSVTSDITPLLENPEQLSARFEEEANFCAGSTQVHTHSPTCVKYSFRKNKRGGDLCRFKAPWKLIERTALTPDGVLEIRRTHPMVNRWNQAMAVGLRHNHDISFIATQRKTMALVYYVTNYATKVEDPIWKRVAAAADLFPVATAADPPTAEEAAEGAATGIGANGGGGGDGVGNKTRQFLMRVANRVFTERPLSQVEVVADLLGYPVEYKNSSGWAYLNVSLLYWHIFRRWRHLRRESGTADAEAILDESVVVEEAGQRIGFAEAYAHRGDVLRGLCLYDYVSLVKLQRAGKDGSSGAWGEVPFDDGWADGKQWVQVLRRPGKHATVCLDGYLSKDFDQVDDESCHYRAAVQHLALFVPWEDFLAEQELCINEIWTRARRFLSPRISCLVGNVQLLRRSAEDAKRDAKQWASTSGDTGGPGSGEVEGSGGEGGEAASAYEANDVGIATRLIDVLRSAVGACQITAGSPELRGAVKELSRFQHSALSCPVDLQATMVAEDRERCVALPGLACSGAPVPPQAQVRAIKSQQICASRERVKMIQGVQNIAVPSGTDRAAAAQSILAGFGEDDVHLTQSDAGGPTRQADAGMSVRLGPSTSFVHAGKALAARLTLNKRQAIAFLILCRRLDLLRQGDEGDVAQLCQFVGGKGGTGKSRVIQALVDLFASMDMSSRLLITATSGTATARINGITIHSACGLSKDVGAAATAARDLDGVRLPKLAERFVHGESRMDWREKDVLVIDEVSMLGARTLHAVHEQLCQLRGHTVGRLQVVQRRAAAPARQRARTVEAIHDSRNARRANARGRRSCAEAAAEADSAGRPGPHGPRAPQLPVLSGRQANTVGNWHHGRDAAEQKSVESQHGGRPSVPSSAAVVDAHLRVRAQVEGRHTDGGGSDHGAQPWRRQRHPRAGHFHLVNGASYTAAEVVADKAYPAHRVSAGQMIHFGPPAGIILESETTKYFHFVGMPPGTILLTPMSVRIPCQRKRPWQQNDVSRRGLPCAAAFACTDYKVQGGTLERVALELVALELRGTRTTNLRGRMVPSHCDPYSLYVQLSRCPTLDGIMLVSKARERDLVGNRVPEEMSAAQARLEELSEKTIREALSWLGDAHGREGGPAVGREQGGGGRGSGPSQ